MSRTFLGLDIRQDTVSAVVVKSTMKGGIIESHLQMRLDQNSPEESHPLAAALEQIAEVVNFKEVICVAALPSGSVSYRNISVPFKDHKKIRQILPYELEPMLPRSADELEVDYYVIQENETSDLLAATLEKETLNTYLEILSQFHLDPVLVTVGAFPTAVTLSHVSNSYRNMVVVDSDNRNHTLYIVVNRRIALVRGFARSKAAQSDLMGLSLNIHRTLAGIEDLLNIEFEPEAVLLSGYGIDAPKAELKLAAMLKIDVVRFDPVNDPNAIKPEIPSTEWNPFVMQNACSLVAVELVGYECLNFYKSRYGFKRHLHEHRKNITITGILVICVLILWLGGVLFESHDMQTKLDEHNQEIETIFKEAFPKTSRIQNAVHQMDTEIRELKKQISGSESSDSIPNAIDILYTISDSLPKELDVKLERFIINKEGMQLSGNSNGFDVVDTMKGRLEKNKEFKTVTISSANMEKNGKRVRFKLRIELGSS
jgi:type II secretory pathway component PulL